MEYLNTQLRQLQQKVARKNQLQTRLTALRGQRSTLLDKVADLDKIAIR